MPSTLPPRVSTEIFARKIWRNPHQLQQVRSGSAAQSIKISEGDAGASTFLYNGNLGRDVIGKQSTIQAPRVSPKKLLQQASRDKQSPTPASRVSPKKSAQQASRVDINSQLRTSSEPHSTPQQDKDSPPLSHDKDSSLQPQETDSLPLSQDEKLIRKPKIPPPTRQDYPNISPGVFTDPKGHILRVLQGKADITAKFNKPRLKRNLPPKFQCTLHCKSRELDELDVGIGHGLDKVGFADRSMNPLTVPRIPPSYLRIKI